MIGGMNINAGAAVALLTLDASSYVTGLATAAAAARSFKSGTASLSDVMSAFGQSLEATGTKLTTTITVAALGAAAACAAAAADLQDSVNKVSTIADTTILSQAAIKDGLQDLAVDTGKSTGLLADGMYNLISATGDTTNALDYLGISTKTAVGGFTEVNTAVDGLTTVMNAYGQSGTAAYQSIADMMLMAQNFGKTTVGEISSSIGNVAATASSMKVSAAELMATIATLTKDGLGTSEAITGLKAAISNILAPTADASKIAKELGIDFSATALQAQGLSGFVDMLTVATGGNTQQMSQLFGSVEALNAMLILTGTTGGKDFDNALAAMAASSGAVDKAYATMSSGISTQTAKLKQNVVGLAQDYGDLLAPAIESLIGKASEAITHIRNLDEGTQSFVLTMGTVAAAAGPVILSIGKLITMFSGPVGWIALAATATAGLIAFTAAASDATSITQKFLDQSVDKDVAASMTAKLKGEVEIDTTNVATDTQTALDTLKSVISTTLTPEQVNEIVGLIDGSLDPIEKAFSTFGVPEGSADALETAVKEARATLYAKLQKLGLTPEQIDYVCNNLIGEDYDTVYNTILGFGLSPEAAGQVAQGVTDANDTISGAWAGFDLLTDEDKSTLINMVNSARAALYYTLVQMGLTDDQINYILGVFDGIQTKLSEKLPSLRDEVLKTYTDGQADTTQIVKDLADQVTGIYEEAKKQVDKWFEDEKAKLDPTSPTYDAELAALSEKRSQYMSDLETSATGLTTWLSTMANASKENVEANIEQFNQLMAVMQEVINKTNEANEAVTDRNRNAYEAVSKGTVTDEDSVVRAGQYANSQYQTDLESIKANAAADRAKIDQAVAEGWMSADQGNAAAEEVTKAEAEETAKAKAAYLEMINNIFEGLGEVEPEISDEMKNKVGLTQLLEDVRGLIDRPLSDGYNVPTGSDLLTDQLKAWIIANIGELDFDEEDFNSAKGIELSGYLKEVRNAIKEQLEEPVSDEPSMIGTAFQSFLDAGYFEPLDLDGTTTLNNWKLMGGDLGTASTDGMTEGINDGAASVKTAMEAAGLAAIAGGKGVLGVNSPSRVFHEVGIFTMQGWANGINSGQSLVVDAIRRAAQAAVLAAKAALVINSPSAVFAEIGKYTAQGFALGIDENAFLADDAMRDLSTRGAKTARESDFTVGAESTGGKTYNFNFYDTVVNGDNDIRSLARKLGQYLKDADKV